MGATKRDGAGVLTAELPQRLPRRTAVLDQVFHLGPKGITFATNKYVPEWTEVGVEMRLPSNGDRKDQQIDCRGVIVQCARRDAGTGFQVSLLFLDLPRKAHSHLTNSSASSRPLSISISR